MASSSYEHLFWGYTACWTVLALLMGYCFIALNRIRRELRALRTTVEISAAGPEAVPGVADNTVRTVPDRVLPGVVGSNFSGSAGGARKVLGE